MTLADLQPGEVCTVLHMGGARSFRRRLMELGLLPGTLVELVGVAPLGDPLELLARGCSLSIRRTEAESVSVMRSDAPTAVLAPPGDGSRTPVAAGHCDRCSTPACHDPASS